MEDWNRPPRLSSSSLTWIAGLSLLSASPGETISSGITTGSWQVLGFRRTGRAAALLLRSPNAPARGWGGNAAFGTRDARPRSKPRRAHGAEPSASPPARTDPQVPESGTDGDPTP